MIIIYVDNFIITVPTDFKIELVVAQLRQYYDIKDLREPKQYLNYALVRNYINRTITITQHIYVQKVLRMADVSGFKDTPLPPAQREQDSQDGSTVLNDNGFEYYQKVIGILNQLAIKTRLDIRFAVTRLQYKLALPTFHDLEAIRHVVKYLRSNGERGLIFRKTDNLQFSAYTDASHADWPDSKSTEGVVWFFTGSPVIQSTKKQTVTANSTTVAEWYALDQPSRDAIQLAKIADSLQLPRPEPTVIFTDNINSQLLLAKRGGKAANRQLTLRYFFVRDAVAQGHVSIRRVDTKGNAADGFTKALPKDQFKRFIELLGMI